MKTWFLITSFVVHDQNFEGITKEGSSIWWKVALATYVSSTTKHIHMNLAYNALLEG